MHRSDLIAGTAVVALLSLTDGEAAPVWVQLTPVSKGPYTSQDGRSFRIDDPDAVIRDSMARGAIPIDRDHATDLAAKNGLPAPAIGWITELAKQGPGNEPGIWGKVDWTNVGKQSFADREYRYLSPVTFSAKATGAVVIIARAALTNDPALVMKGLFSMQEKIDLDPKELCALLGLPETASADDIRTAINSLKQGNAAMCSNEKAIADALGAKDGKLTAELLVGVCAKLKAPALTGDTADIAKLRSDLDAANVVIAQLSRQGAENTATARVDAAVKDGKLTPAQKKWAIDYCSRDPEGFAKYIEAAPTLLSDGRLKPEGQPADALSETEIAVCTQLNLTADQFKAQKALDRKENV